MSVQIISGGITFTFNEGDVERVETNISCDPEHDAMPGLTAESALLFDFNGVLKIINIDGVISSDGTNRLSTGSAATIDEQRQWVEKILNGAQSGVTFKSNYSSTYNGSTFVDSVVLFAQIRFTEETGNPAGLPFRASLLVGSA